ncbi:class I SAM-dependent methyltransferase [Oceanimonas baumannii]|uniref:class I SAM-dependent methyltransferase n=1 Tax=Oceanimonas baumannii TaxID=129578 RepID=UPI003A919B2E
MDTNELLQKLHSIEAKNNKILKELTTVSNNLYSQLESLFWLQKRLNLKKQLPPLRGWPVSPDFLLKLHTYITEEKPKTIVETGSGVTTLVITDALRHNGTGHLYSLEHLEFYGNQTRYNIEIESLQDWVSIRTGPVINWTSEHINQDNGKPSMWYPLHTLDNIENIDLLIVDGPPASTCPYARYPALPATFNKLSPRAQVWMDDANREDEIEICKHWAKEFNMDIDFIPLEKGLCVLSKKEKYKNTMEIDHSTSHSFNFGIKSNNIG